MNYALGGRLYRDAKRLADLRGRRFAMLLNLTAQHRKNLSASL